VYDPKVLLDRFTPAVVLVDSYLFFAWAAECSNLYLGRPLPCFFGLGLRMIPAMLLASRAKVLQDVPVKRGGKSSRRFPKNGQLPQKSERARL